MRSDNMPRPFAPLHDMEAKLLDIVVRLRYMASDGDHLGVNELTVDTAHLREAADEIERLREIERENDGVIAVWRRRCNEAEDERDKLYKDVAQLRDLLEELEACREGSRVAHAELRTLKAKIEAAPKCRVYEARCLGFDDPDRDEITDIVKGRMLVKLVKCDD